MTEVLINHRTCACVDILLIVKYVHNCTVVLSQGMKLMRQTENGST